VFRYTALAALVAAAALVVVPLRAQSPTTPPAQATPTPTAAPTQGRSEIIQKIIVKVNGEILTQTELEQRQIQALRDENKLVQKPEDLQNDATLRAALAEVTPGILVQAVNDLLLVGRGKEIGAHLSDDQFKKVVERVKTENKLDDKGLVAALAQEGMTMETYRQMMDRQYLMQAVQQQEIGQHMNLTEEESRQYYQAHPDQFMKPATVMLREIFVSVPTQTQNGQTVFNAADDDAAKAKAEQARERVQKGEDFAKVAGEVSESASKANGGLVGPVNVTDMAPALRDVIEKLEPGQMTEPLRTSRGYQLFKLESRTPAAVEAFEKVRDQIAQKIYDSRLDGETKKLLDRLRAQALIEWKDVAYEKMYDAKLAEAGKSGQ
jgi:peptidyl-prolyl cis-trans isomerase SurA